ncbi:MAG: WbqC family protein [Nitrosopumilaceae archaeon]
MVTLGIHQPTYLPWLGFFKKMMQCDKFVFFDDVQINKKSFHNRNKIRTNTNWIYLTIPIIAGKNTKINEVKIDNTKNWAKKHEKSIIFNYAKAKYFEDYKKNIELIYGKKYDLLIDLDIEIIEFIMKQLQIKTKIFRSSELDIQGQGSERILNICKELNTDVYISGTVWAKEHLRLNDFSSNKINVKFQNFIHPKYKQCFEPFLPNMAAIDLLFNEGENAVNILKNALVN